MTPIQQLYLGVGAKKKTYLDDVFHTQVYQSTNANADYKVTNNIDNSGEGGFLWYKDRNGSGWHLLWDTERGSNKYIYTNSDSGGSTAELLKSFDSDGYTIKTGTTLVGTDRENVLWNFRKAPGFFDILEFTETGSDATISHQLGSVPGMIIMKTTSRTSPWFVYHRGIGESKWIKLNETGGATSFSSGGWGSVTSSSFNFTNQVLGYGSGTKWIVYVFAGGESTAATARSVGFSSSSTYLSIPDSNDFDFGSTFTFEAWVKPEFHGGNLNLIFEHGSFQIAVQDDGRLQFDPNHIHTGGDFYSSTGSVPEGQWTHVAVVGTSGTLKMYINGVNNQSHSRTGVDITGDTGAANISDLGGYYFKGEISNLRIVKGTAVYASSFRPPTEPLTNITNTVLLCCNDSSTTGSTVTPNTITANGSPTAETDSPFDDPAAHVFGASGSENVIKTGSYTGNGVGWQPTDSPPNLGLFVECGFEPQWIIVKRTSPNGGDWKIVNCMTGMGHNVTGETIAPNNSNASEDGIRAWAEPTGFRLGTSSSQWNYNGGEYIFCAVRRSDGYCGKPPELGSDCFQMSTSASAVPRYSSGFPVDFAFKRRPATTENTQIGARIIGKNRGFINATTTFSDNNSFVWDSNSHWPGGGGDDANVYQAWMWSRGQGCDVLAYEGTGSTQVLSHSLGKNVEMAWIKRRDGTDDWKVYHSGTDSSNPENYNLTLNSNGARDYSTSRFGAPSSTHFTVNTHATTNGSGNSYLMMLFASVSGISSVGSFTGDGTSDGSHEITCGFTPRFLIIKCTTSGVNFAQWLMWDSERLLDGSGIEYYLKLNSDGAQVTSYDYLDTTSTGFKLNTNYGPVNGSGNNMIYYAHA